MISRPSRLPSPSPPVFPSVDFLCLLPLSTPSVYTLSARPGCWRRRPAGRAGRAGDTPTHAHTLSMVPVHPPDTVLLGCYSYGYAYGAKRMHKCMFCASRMLCACIDVTAHVCNHTSGRESPKTLCVLRIASVNLHTTCATCSTYWTLPGANV